MNNKIYKISAGALVFIISIIVYIKTLAPTVWFIDSGELASVASTLGIAHPTGYPLFTIIGYLFTKLPISASEVYNLNVMSAFFCALGAYIFALALSFIFSKYETVKAADKQKKPIAKKEEKPAAKPGAFDYITFLIIPAVSALLLAFSRTYWSNANSVEVYPLHIFFLTLLIFLFLKAVLETRSANNNESFFRQNKYYLLFALVLGLSFTNHLTTILLAPACLTLFFYKNLYDKKRLYKLLGWMAVLFIIGLSVYIYLPLRANMEPSFLWGNPFNWERFKWHVTGKQFSVWIFSAKGSIAAFLLLLASTIGLSVYGLIKQKKLNRSYHFLFFVIIGILGYFFIKSSDKIVVQQFDKFTGSLGIEFGIGVVILALPGIYYLSRFNVTTFYFTLLTFFGCVFYSVNYDINDIFSYFLLAYITIAVWIAFGILYIYRTAKSYLNTPVNKAAFGAVIALILILPINTNYTFNDESKNTYIEELTMNIFANAEPNSIIISSQWDFWVSSSWYFNNVKNIRKDLVIIDKELLRRSWYFVFLQRHYPEIYNNSKAEIERFLPELYKFEHDIPYDQAAIVKAFEDMATSFVVNNPGRRAYVTWEIEQNKNEPFAKEYVRVPDGLLFRLVKSNPENKYSLPDYKIFDFKFTPVTKTDYYNETISQCYCMMLTNSAYYLITQNRLEDARKYLAQALIAKPNYSQALELKRKYSL